MRIRLASAIVLAALLLAACGRTSAPSLRFEENGAPLTAAAADKLTASTDISSVSDVTADRAPALRNTMLQQLRLKGASGEHAAQLLTTGFPVSTPSVPVLVRLCSFEGTSAVVVVEAFADPGGTLTHRRLWVFAAARGDIIRATSFR